MNQKKKKKVDRGKEWDTSVVETKKKKRRNVWMTDGVKGKII